MGHAGSITRSQGHLVHFKHLASCLDSDSKSVDPIFTKPGQKLYLDDIKVKSEYGSCRVKN